MNLQELVFIHTKQALQFYKKSFFFQPCEVKSKVIDESISELFSKLNDITTEPQEL
jgi:hypothetical protein